MNPRAPLWLPYAAGVVSFYFGVKAGAAQQAGG